MEIILKKDVDNLGAKDELVSVKDGYARNFLIPKGMAIFASPSAKKMREENLKQQAHKIEKQRKEFEKQLQELQSMVVTVGAKVGESGKIFGSVNTLQLAEALKKLGFEIDRKNITIKDEPIKQVGKYTAHIKLMKELTTDITFEVVEE